MDALVLAGAIAFGVVAVVAVCYAIILSFGVRGEIEASLAWIRSDSRYRRIGAGSRALLGHYATKVLLGAVPLGRRLVSKSSLQDLERQITYAGSPAAWRLDRILAMKAWSVFVGVLLALGSALLVPNSRGLLFGGAIAVLGYEIPDLRIRAMAKQRQKALQRSLAETLDLLTVTVEAGMSFDAAISQISQHTQGPLAGEFNRFLREKQIGLSSQAALEALGQRSSVEDFRTFTSAIGQAERLGISIAPVLREQTHEMRLRNRQLAEEKAQKVPVKILLPLIFMIFPAILIIILAPAGISIMEAFG